MSSAAVVIVALRVKIKELHHPRKQIGFCASLYNIIFGKEAGGVLLQQKCFLGLIRYLLVSFLMDHNIPCKKLGLMSAFMNQYDFH